MGWTCKDPDVIRRLKERIDFFRSRGTHFIYTRHNIHPHYANDIISRVYDIIESESDTVVHMGHYSQTEFIQKYPDSRNVIIPYHIYQYTYKEDISIERARQYLNLPQEAFVVRLREIPQPGRKTYVARSVPRLGQRTETTDSPSLMPLFKAQ